MKALLTTMFCFAMTGLCAQQLTYKPKNPAFGGDTFNYQWLLSSANAQNSFQNQGSQREERSELQEFQESLNRQVLGQLTRSVFNSQLGEDGLKEGTFNVGSLVLEIFESDEGFVINILDTNSGEQTQVIVPN
ncbi:curli production assembly/transport component CsgF [Robertkochia flava]|uniref:curli production assembly/transport component CsgF n=1 Tax=Robertkochia flava TaxID=3447986 RepID=UPI001CCAB81E|nr:curli production assembly/transport component CsgF [Robertkochia marina]